MQNTDYNPMAVPTNEPIDYRKPTPDLDEVAAKSPEALSENSDERMLRERAEYFYRCSNPYPGFSSYAAGWLAAKAHYESK